jgi:PAS domain S-box-containing protein
MPEIIEARTPSPFVGSFRPAAPYLAALGIIGLAFLLRSWLMAGFGPLPPYILFSPAVMLVALLWGFTPGLVATALAALASFYWILPPRGRWSIEPFDVAGLVVFIFMGVFMSSVAALFLRARHRVAALERDRALHERDERLAVTLRSIGDAVIAIDREGRITVLNAIAEALTGWRAGDALGRPLPEVFRIVDERTRQPAASSVERVLREGVVVAPARHTALVARDGSECPIAESGAPIRDEEGHVTGVVLVFRDQTQERRAEEAQARLAAIVQSSDDVIVSKDLEGRILTWNAAAEKLLGYSAAEAVGQPIDLIIPPERRSEERDILLRIRAGAAVAHLETQRVTKAGAVLDVSITVSPLRDRDGQLIGASKILRDITAQKQSEEALRLNDQRLRTLADSMPQLAWTARPDGYVTWYNRRWYEYTGTTPAQVEGWGWQSVHDPATLPGVLRRWKDSIATGTTFDMEFPLRSVDGRFRRFLTRVSPLKDSKGNVVQWFGTSTDVTDILEAQDELRESDRRKSEFIAVLSHELRNPLAPIRNSLYLLGRAPPGSDRFARGLEIIHRQTEHLTRLVDDLLDVTRISRGKVELQRARVDVREVLRRVCDDHRALFHERNLELRIELSAPAWIDADETRIAQVIGNLLHNAAKFTHEGGTVTASVQLVDGVIELRVRDDGIGIAPELLPRLFEPFVQADGGLARTKGGLGLGLALVKGLVELHGGSVRAESSGTGRGTALVVRLPPASRPGEPAARQALAAATRPIEILVIEDNLDAARSVADVLELEGHHVHLATDGQSGIAKALELMPDVILCDLGLPDVDGYQVARTLRAELGATRLIALSGYAQPEDRRKAQEAGFDAHVSKPPAIDLLLAAVAHRGRQGA